MGVYLRLFATWLILAVAFAVADPASLLAQAPMTLHSHPGLVKSVQPYLSTRNGTNFTPVGPAEVSPFVFKGQLWTLTGNAPSGDYDGTVRIDGMLLRPFKTVPAPGLAYPVPFVKDGVLQVFGTSLDHKTISHMSTTDLVTWTSPQVVYTATNGQGFFNVSVTDSPSGYVMVAETVDPDFPGIPFVLRFLRSNDLTNWTMTGGLYNNGNFANCPTIRFYDGYFYVLYMSGYMGQHITFLTRTADPNFLAWENASGFPDGNTVPFVASAGEGNNNSDVDMIDFNGMTFFTYTRGDQTSWLEVSTAVFHGSEKAFLQSFYPPAP